jgi:hypothetical protein
MWYSESMPSDYYTGCSYSYYREKHNPTTIFASAYKTCNKKFVASNWKDTSFLKSMAPVVCITPNMINDMHDGTVSQGDTWLKNNMEFYRNWAMTHNSILVIYYDEAESSSTSNLIPVTMVGQYVKVAYKNNTRYNHYSFTKWVSSMYGGSTSWTSNITNATAVSGIWK